MRQLLTSIDKYLREYSMLLKILSFVLPVISMLIYYDFTKGYCSYYGTSPEMITLPAAKVIKSIFVTVGITFGFLLIIGLCVTTASKYKKRWKRFLIGYLMSAIFTVLLGTLSIITLYIDSWSLVLTYFWKIILLLPIVSIATYIPFFFSNEFCSKEDKNSTCLRSAKTTAVTIIVSLIVITISLPQLFIYTGKISAQIPTTYTIIESSQNKYLVIGQDKQGNLIANPCQINELNASKDSLRKCHLSKKKLDEYLNRCSVSDTGNNTFSLATLSIEPKQSLFDSSNIDYTYCIRGIVNIR